VKKTQKNKEAVSPKGVLQHHSVATSSTERYGCQRKRIQIDMSRIQGHKRVLDCEEGSVEW